ncbi:hypothetical protein GQ600_3675 [Phytophthora cactorum]|nr:hypothetical protein GQ600_3675 [Phytophthora cactorum]
MDLAWQVEAVKNIVIGEKTMKMYTRGISVLYQHKRTVLSDELLSSLQTNDHGETGEGVASLTIAGALRYIQTKPNVYPINYALHCSNDFERFLRSFTNKSGGKLGRSVYDFMRSSWFHLQYCAIKPLIPPPLKCLSVKALELLDLAEQQRHLRYTNIFCYVLTKTVLEAPELV